MIGIIFATRREAEPFIEHTNARKLDDEQFPVWRVPSPLDAAVLICGMGKRAASAGIRHLIETYRPLEVVNAGICGSAAEGLEPGTVCCVSEVRDGNTEAAPIPCGPGRFAGLPAARLTTSDKPVFDPERRQEIAAWGELVDMEGAAIADECSRRGIPCVLLKGVSDMADDAGKQAIRSNIDAVSEKVADALIKGLAAMPAADAGLWRKLLNFTKIEHTIFSLPLFFSGAWLGAGRQMPPLRVLGLIITAGVGARVLAMSMNRILDRKLDALNPRTADRELPSGRMSLTSAAFIAFAAFAVYTGACALLGPLVLMLSPGPALALIGYSLLKRFTPLCHFGIGVCMAMAPLGAFIAAAERLSFCPEILLLGLFAFCWISGFDIIYALQDIESDRRTGVQSIPAALGSGRAQLVAAAVHAVAVASAIALLLLAGDGPLGLLALAVAVGAFICAYLPVIPLPARFFPASAVAGIAGALVPLLGKT